MTAILFTKPGCSDCEWIKAHCDLTGVAVHELDGENAEALGLLAYYSCVTIAEKKLPILVVGDDEIPEIYEIVSDFAAIRDQLVGRASCPPAGEPEDCGDACKL